MLWLSWMMLQYIAMPCRCIHMGIYLRSDDAFMPEHLLDHPQVRSPLNHMGRKRMSERMRRYILPYIRNQSLLLYHLEDGHPAQRLAETVQEDQFVRERVCCCRPGFKIVLERLRRHVPQRNQPVLITLSDNSHETVLKKDTRKLEVHGLRDTQPASIQNFEYGTVTQTLPCRCIDRTYHRLHLLFRQHIREIDTQFRSVNLVARIIGHDILHNQPSEEGSQRTENSRLGTLGNIRPFMQVGYDIVRTSSINPAGKRIEEPPDIRNVRCHSIQ